ncbi:hypothetical protein M758_UG041000 [Ceratodon purpureus]|nr:hypothetical protein M758_UG041000 [Ceratodon purpureus]
MPKRNKKLEYTGCTRHCNTMKTPGHTAFSRPKSKKIHHDRSNSAKRISITTTLKIATTAMKSQPKTNPKMYSHTCRHNGHPTWCSVRPSVRRNPSQSVAPPYQTITFGLPHSLLIPFIRWEFSNQSPDR